MGKKVCKSCLIEKDISGFYYRKDNQNYKSVCKTCCINGKKIPKDPDNKTCKHCNEKKPNSEYQKAGGGKWLQPYCKSCDSDRKKKWEIENSDNLKVKSRERYLLTREQTLAKSKEERRIAKLTRPKRVFKRMPEEERKKRKSDQDRKYREKKGMDLILKKREYNKGRGLELKREWQKKRMNDPEFRITKNLRGRIYVALKRGVKSKPTKELLGCTIQEFIKYFGDLFSEGMSWEKYMEGGIHIDHIRPCASFDLTDPAQQKECFHYTNLQPLWELDNLVKGAKILSNAS